MKKHVLAGALIFMAAVFPARPDAQGLSEIKVVQWNVQDGEQPSEIDVIVAQKPDVVFLEEVDHLTHLDALVNALEVDQSGSNWDYRFVHRDNTFTTTGTSYLAILTRFTFSGAVQTKLLNAAGESICGAPVTDPRAAIGATILINGNPYAVFATRNTFLTGDCVAKEQNTRFKAWADGAFPNVTQLYGGDFNMLPSGMAYPIMTTNAPQSTDAWMEAVNKGTATAVDSGIGPNTPTKNNRLDYLFYKNASSTSLSTKSAHITTLNSALSDHRMMTAIFTLGTAAPTTLLVDDFNDNTIDPKWSIGVWSGTSQDATIPVAETNQRLEVGPLPQGVTGTHYNALRSTASYSLSGAYAYVQLAQPASTATGAFSMFTVGKDASNYYRWYVSAGRLVVEKKIGGSKSTVLDIGYDPAAHQFLRVCHDAGAGSVVFQTAANSGGAPGGWTQRYSETWNTTAIPLSAVLFEMKAGTSASEVAPGTAVFDNFRAAAAASCQ